MRLSHVDESGKARMVDVSAKEVVRRRAVAQGMVRMHEGTVRQIRDNLMKKGDVLGAAQIAGVMAAKRTGELIPLCHPLPIDHVGVECALADDGVAIRAEATCSWKTGIEMEALTAVSVAALTVYDMCKAVDKAMVIEGVRLVQKTKEPVE